MRRFWAVLAGVVAVGVLATPASATPSKPCAKALRLADTIASQFTDYIVNDIEAFGTDDVAVRARGRALSLRQEYQATLAKYHTAAKKCRT